MHNPKKKRRSTHRRKCYRWLGLDYLEARQLLTAGDFNNDGQLNAADIDALSSAVRLGDSDPVFDLNVDGAVNQTDRSVWVEYLRGTYFGDANLDGTFNSDDLIDVLALREYEDGIAGNSGWAEGDWNGDGEFDSSDAIHAMAYGSYEQRTRINVNIDVPEYLITPTQDEQLNSQNLVRLRQDYPKASLYFPAGTYRFHDIEIDAQTAGINWEGDPDSTVFAFESSERRGVFFTFNRVTQPVRIDGIVFDGQLDVPELLRITNEDVGVSADGKNISITRSAFLNAGPETRGVWKVGLRINGSFTDVGISDSTFRNITHFGETAGARGLLTLMEGKIVVRSSTFQDIYARSATRPNKDGDGIVTFCYDGDDRRYNTSIQVLDSTFINMGRRAFKSQSYWAEFMGNAVYRRNPEITGSADVALQFGGGIIDNNYFYHVQGGMVQWGVISASPREGNHATVTITNNVIEVGDETPIRSAFALVTFAANHYDKAIGWEINNNVINAVSEAVVWLYLFCVNHDDNSSSLPISKRQFQDLTIDGNRVLAANVFIQSSGVYNGAYPNDYHFGATINVTNNEVVEARGSCSDEIGVGVPVLCEEKIGDGLRAYTSFKTLSGNSGICNEGGTCTA